MSTSRKRKQEIIGENPKSGDWKGFVNIPLDEVAKGKIMDLLEGELDLEEVIAGLVSSGFKVTISFDYQSDCFNATAIGTAHVPGSDGYAVSSRSMGVCGALLATRYKVEVLAKNELGKYASTVRKEMDI